ncbi:MAG TPA: hypothetical protein VHM48_10100, partial [Candidatus Limnocylindrales bacterium]|nr:hypothetical protein [Candidatus Limnocylindrales bacterium]
VLTAALAAAGFAPGASPQPVAAADSVAATTPEPTVQVDTVYVAAPAKQQTITVHKVVKSTGGEESEGESGGDN